MKARKITVGLIDAFPDHNNLLSVFENMTSNTDRFSFAETFMV
jgi:hypothetical protein